MLPSIFNSTFFTQEPSGRTGVAAGPRPAARGTRCPPGFRPLLRRMVPCGRVRCAWNMQDRGDRGSAECRPTDGPAPSAVPARGRASRPFWISPHRPRHAQRGLSGRLSPFPAVTVSPHQSVQFCVGGPHSWAAGPRAMTASFRGDRDGFPTNPRSAGVSGRVVAALVPRHAGSRAGRRLIPATRRWTATMTTSWTESLVRALPPEVVDRLPSGWACRLGAHLAREATCRAAKERRRIIHGCGPGPPCARCAASVVRRCADAPPRSAGARRSDHRRYGDTAARLGTPAREDHRVAVPRRGGNGRS